MRPRKLRHVSHGLEIHFFKPQGIPLRQLSIVELRAEEVEALRLKNLENLDQIEAAKIMDTSQSTYQRILSSAYAKVSDALINGKAIKIISHEESEK